MTLCVAVTVPCDELAKRESRLQFVENGIIMLADSRFTFEYEDGRRQRYEDDGLKVVPITDRCLLGYSGVAVVVGRALERLRQDLAWRILLTADLIATRLSGYLSEEHQRRNDYRRVPTDVLLGLRSRNGRRFSLFSLSSADGFQVRDRTGVVAIGSGAAGFRRRFDKGVGFQIQRLLEPPHPADFFSAGSGQIVMNSSLFRNGTRLVRVQDVVAAVSMMALGQIRTGTDPTVGGAFQLFVLTRFGCQPWGASWSTDQGETWEVATRSDLTIPAADGARIGLRQPVVTEPFPLGGSNGTDVMATPNA